MKRTAWLALGGIVLVAVACGGTSTDLIGDGGASGDGAANGDGGGGGDGGGARDGAIARGDGGSCPDIGGSFSLSHSGDGCGDLSADITECIQVDNSCAAQLKASGGGRGVEGNVFVGADGSFSGANLKLGSADRSGCTGTWDDGTSTLTIDCGGTGTSQSCVVTLTRTSTATCN